MVIKFMYWNCEIVKENYANNGRICLSLIAAENDSNHDTLKGDAIADLTVNVPSADIEPDEVLIKNYSENTGILDILIDAGVVKDTGRRIVNGFVGLPVCKVLV